MSTIMAHMVVGFPDIKRSEAVAHGLAAGGAAYLEMQFPFSDPTADGPSIQEACQVSLERGFRVEEGFELVARVSQQTRLPIYIMTYASMAYRRGIASFLRAGKEAGVVGFIIPDLPLDYDEGAYARAAGLGLEMMPVVVATARRSRIELLADRRPKSIYAALRSGITGTRTEIGGANIDFLSSLREITPRVFAGFGIQEREQVVAVEPHAHAVIVGSALVRVVAKHADESAQAINAAVREATAELVDQAQ